MILIKKFIIGVKLCEMNQNRIQKFLRYLEKDYKKPTGLKTSELPRLAFLLQKYDHSKCGQIVVKFIDSRSKIKGN